MTGTLGRIKIREGITMSEQSAGPDKQSVQSHLGTYTRGKVHLDVATDWPDGTRVQVRVAATGAPTKPELVSPAIIAGFGLAGRWAADLFERCGIQYVVVEKNAQTVARQMRLGKHIIEGDICEEQTLHCAGIEQAQILALTIPDEQAVFKATDLAKRLNPSLYIIARTLYASSGLRARALGASEVVKAEQAVAREFYERLARRLAEAGHVVLGRVGEGQP
jgi:hypothetical protein